MTFVDELSLEDSNIIKLCYHAGVWGPFFQGLIWEPNTISTYAGPPIEALRVISSHWPNIDHPVFFNEYRSAFSYANDASDEQVLTSAICAFNSVVYWIIHYFVNPNASNKSGVAESFKKWIPYEIPQVIDALENYLRCYDAWREQR